MVIAASSSTICSLYATRLDFSVPLEWKLWCTGSLLCRGVWWAGGAAPTVPCSPSRWDAAPLWWVFCSGGLGLGCPQAKWFDSQECTRVHVEHETRQNVKACAYSLWEARSLLRVRVRSVSGHFRTQPLMPLHTSACWCHTSPVVNKLPCTGEG